MCKSFVVNQLLDIHSNSVYDCAVSDAEFWLAVGRELQRRRIASGAASTYAFHQAHRGAPVTNTLDVIEEGRAGRVDNLDRYCRALKVTMADVVRSVLAAEDGTVDASVTDEERSVIALHRDLEKDPKRQAAWLDVGRGLAALVPTRTPPPTPRRRQ